MHNVLVKSDITIFIAKEAIKLGQGWVALVISPSVLLF